MSESCTARIFPPWASRWMECGSPVRADGRCIVYEHKQNPAQPVTRTDPS